MESYVEVSFLFACVTIFFSVKVSCYACIKPIRNQRICFYAICISICGCFFFSHAWILMLIIEAIFFIKGFSCRKKVYLLAYAIRWFLFFSVFAWFDGSFHNGIYFVPMKESLWQVWLLYGMVGWFLKYKWKLLLAKADYVYPITLDFDDGQLHMKGYLDSGNLLCHDHIPVVFVDTKYSSYFAKKSIELVVMNTIQNEGILHCYPCKMVISDMHPQKVYVSCEKKLQLPYDCEVLLNMNAMTLG